VTLIGRQRWLGIFFAIATASPACRYSVDPDTGKFHCASDSDCGSGWLCFNSCQAGGFSAYCLQDGDCEPCPSLEADPLNCGSCGISCSSGDECIDGVCAATVLPDAGQPDAGQADAGSDAGFDAGLDGGEDAGVDGGEDAGHDAGHPDGSFDAGPDAGLDSGEDAGSDAGIDGGEDAGEDGGLGDAGLADAGDGGTDAGE
jgi:hypothetical protein